MKIFGSILLLILGFATKGMAQEHKIPDFNFDKPLLLPGSKFKLPENLQSFTLDTSLNNSKLPFLPRSLSIDRENKPILTMPNQMSFQSRMPIHKLPDSDSRMPVKIFDDSVNYTILKKEF
jgi:hypothetical protein